MDDRLVHDFIGRLCVFAPDRPERDRTSDDGVSQHHRPVSRGIGTCVWKQRSDLVLENSLLRRRGGSGRIWTAALHPICPDPMDWGHDGRICAWFGYAVASGTTEKIISLARYRADCVICSAESARCLRRSPALEQKSLIHGLLEYDEVSS